MDEEEENHLNATVILLQNVTIVQIILKESRMYQKDKVEDLWVPAFYDRNSAFYYSAFVTIKNVILAAGSAFTTNSTNSQPGKPDAGATDGEVLSAIATLNVPSG